MKQRKYEGLAAAALLVAMALLTGCTASGTQSASSGAPAASQAAAAADTSALVSAEYTDRDLDGSWDAASAVTVALSGSTAEISGAGAACEAGVLTISKAGTYVLSGGFSGQVMIEAGDEDKVQLVLNGAQIESPDGPAIWIKAGDKVFITLADGSENALTDSATYTLAEGEDEPNACVYSKADLVWNGTGSVTITGNYNHAVFSKDDLKIVDATVKVTAVNDGLKGKDCVAIRGATLEITAGGDGISASNDEDNTRGWVCVDGGTIAINATGKGIKAVTALQMNDGTITVDAQDDALHTNGSMQLAGGSITLSSQDDGAHADDTLTICGGTVCVLTSYEGLEGQTIEITDGEITVTATDDGLNAAGGNDASGMAGMFGQDRFSSDGDTPSLNISGGRLIVDAAGDGLDSNGTLTVSGGVVLVSGPTNDGNGALDTGTEATITGGYVIAAGSPGMAVNFGTNSTQGTWLASTGSQSGGTLLTLTDADGNVLLSWAPAKDYSCAVVSSPEMVQDGTYILVCGGAVAGADANGYAAFGTVQGGSEAATVTLSSLSTSDVAGGMGGMGGGNRGNREQAPETGDTAPQNGDMAQGGTPPQNDTIQGGRQGGTRPDAVSGATQSADSTPGATA